MHLMWYWCAVNISRIIPVLSHKTKLINSQFIMVHGVWVFRPSIAGSIRLVQTLDLMRTYCINLNGRLQSTPPGLVKVSIPSSSVDIYSYWGWLKLGYWWISLGCVRNAKFFPCQIAQMNETAWLTMQRGQGLNVVCESWFRSNPYSKTWTNNAHLVGSGADNRSLVRGFGRLISLIRWNICRPQRNHHWLYRIPPTTRMELKNRKRVVEVENGLKGTSYCNLHTQLGQSHLWFSVYMGLPYLIGCNSCLDALNAFFLSLEVEWRIPVEFVQQSYLLNGLIIVSEIELNY